MKNLLVLGAIALLLFSLSAALSLWLNQSKQETAQTDKATPDKKDDGKAIPPKNGAAHESPKEPEKKIPNIAPPSAGSPEAGVRDQQEKLERKALQISLVLADVQAQREATDMLLKQVTAEFKSAALAPPAGPSPEQLRKSQEEALKNERLNL
ncbi:MAG TPA: hypothetical protein VGE74_13735, partial [Gemmata sp.]